MQHAFAVGHYERRVVHVEWLACVCGAERVCVGGGHYERRVVHVERLACVCVCVCACVVRFVSFLFILSVCLLEIS